MTMNKLAGLVLTWFIGQISCAIGDGLFIGPSDGPFITTVNQLMGFQVVSSNGLVSVTTGISWITDGLSKILLWNYSCLEGGMFIVRIFMLVLSIAGVFGIYQALRGTSS